MLSSLSMSANSSKSRRVRRAHSPIENFSASKRAKTDDHDQSRSYASICVKNISSKLSDSDVLDFCKNKFSRYGPHKVKIHYKSQERIAFVNFNSYEEARKACHAKTGLVWENQRVTLEPVFNRRSAVDEPSSRNEIGHDRSPSYNRQHRQRSANSQSSTSATKSRNQRVASPSSDRSRSMRDLITTRRPYSPFIPIPPDLVNYAKRSTTQQSSNSPNRPKNSNQKRISNDRRSRSSSSPSKSTNKKSSCEKPSRTLIVDNLDRDISQNKLKETFARCGIINKIEIKKSSSSKHVSAVIQFENVDMAFKANSTFNGTLIGKSECKISYGKTNPTKTLWVSNIPVSMKYHQLEYAFARYGQIRRFDYRNGDSTAVVSFTDAEDAAKAREVLNGASKILDGPSVRRVPVYSTNFELTLRIDFIEKLSERPNPSIRSSSRRSSTSESRSRSSSQSENEEKNDSTIDVKNEIRSRSGSPSDRPQIKQRRSTEEIRVGPIAGRTFYEPIGSYLSCSDTEKVEKLSDLLFLCEQLNDGATQSSTALSTVYPVDFVLKSQNYEARLHFLAGNPTLASLLLGQPGDLVAAKTSLKITQRLRLDQQKPIDLERKLRSGAAAAFSTLEKSSPSADKNRKRNSPAQQSKFVVLIGSSKWKIREKQNSTNFVKKENSTPPQRSISDVSETSQIFKQELTDDLNSPLSQLIFYLLNKEAAGVITIPFYPTHSIDYNHSSKQETAVLQIFPPCEFTETILKLICPSIEFPRTTHDEYLMLIIFHNE